METLSQLESGLVVVVAAVVVLGLLFVLGARPREPVDREVSAVSMDYLLELMARRVAMEQREPSQGGAEPVFALVIFLALVLALAGVVHGSGSGSFP